MSLQSIRYLTHRPKITKEKYKSVVRKFVRPYAGIYVVTCVPVKKKYISASFDVDIELRAERTRLVNGTHKNEKLQSDFNTYGEKAFKFTYIVKIPNKKLKGLTITESYRLLHEVRKDFIKRLKTTDSKYGYNAKAGRKPK